MFGVKMMDKLCGKLCKTSSLSDQFPSAVSSFKKSNIQESGSVVHRLEVESGIHQKTLCPAALSVHHYNSNKYQMRGLIAVYKVRVYSLGIRIFLFILSLVGFTGSVFSKKELTNYLLDNILTNGLESTGGRSSIWG